VPYKGPNFTLNSTFLAQNTAASALRAYARMHGQVELTRMNNWLKSTDGTSANRHPSLYTNCPPPQTYRIVLIKKVVLS